METADAIHEFWFGTDADDVKAADQKKKLWWSKDAAIDNIIVQRFEKSTLAAADGALDFWKTTPRGLLALILLTDQFPRNMYRGTANSFAYDHIALQLSLQALEQGVDQLLRPIERVFVYLPLEHSESIDDQERAVQLFEQLARDVVPAQKSTFDGFHQFAIRHRDIIARFGRFPHRNEILGRTSTEEEISFLKTAGSSF
ncbi:DUF924 family protein [Herminiimonas fonticola]|uniref:Uncharacterized protein (DUF924 family) n=1 Tax=Herminiimonas fonticola TaxID=303380 RepID=A0A4R6G1M4_9BURK|nr:hypothetical protein Hfont_2285 [Herminiimonas fonticola]TDN88271.1 uncharacterized protein (DUF924 family) [Herminiimonas fonticola]